MEKNVMFAASDIKGLFTRNEHQKQLFAGSLAVHSDSLVSLLTSAPGSFILTLPKSSDR
jgi:hypothetical protein